MIFGRRKKHAALRTQDLSGYVKYRGRFLLLGLLVSLLVHLFFLLRSPGVHAPDGSHPKKENEVPVTINIKKKPKTEKKDDSASKQIIEAPLRPTEAPDEPAHLGQQNHKTSRETRVEPSASIKGADSSALQNGRLKIEGGIPDQGGTVPAPQKQGSKYAQLLPQDGELLNLTHNDYIPDKSLPRSAVLDVNTTDYRYIGYFSQVRRLVEGAFTDIGPTLRSSPYVRARLADTGRAKFQGSSQIRLKVVSSGLLTETKLLESTGDKEIDDFWNKILNLAAPYPPLPRNFPSEELVFTYTLYYDVVVEADRKVRRFIL